MKIYVTKDNKIIRQENEGYIAKEGEILISANDIDWPILKRTGGQFLEIHKDNKEIDDIEQGGVTKFIVERDGKIKEIDHKERLLTDKLIKQINPPDMIRVYRGGSSVLTIGTDFDHETESIEHKYTKDELIFENSNLRIMTEQEIFEEKKEKTKLEILNKFKPMIDAMTFQEIAKSKGSNSSNSMFTDDEIKTWGDYISEIAKGNISATQPEIPESYKSIIG